MEQQNKYSLITNPRRTLVLSNAPNIVRKHYPNAQGADRFVYWPDYMVAGTIKDIVKSFQTKGINQVNVGTLYTMSNGQIGCPPGAMPLSEQVVAACAYDPLNPVQTELLMALIGREVRSQLVEMQQPVNKINVDFVIPGRGYTSIRNPEYDISKMSNEIVIPMRTIRLNYSRLENPPITLEYNSQNPAGFTRPELARIISNEYHNAYNTGNYAYGHGIGDLVLENVRQIEGNLFYVSTGS